MPRAGHAIRLEHRACARGGADVPGGGIHCHRQSAPAPHDNGRGAAVMMNSPAIVSMSFDVQDIAPRLRLDAWTDKLNEFYYPLDVEAPGADFSYGWLSSIDIGGVRLGSVDSDAMLVHRRKSHVSARS
jgi:hypothetical protein